MGAARESGAMVVVAPPWLEMNSVGGGASTRARGSPTHASIPPTSLRGQGSPWLPRVSPRGGDREEADARRRAHPGG